MSWPLRFCLAVVVLTALSEKSGLGQVQAFAHADSWERAASAGVPSVARNDFKEFDVASVKENKSDRPPESNFPLGPGDAYGPNGGHFIAANMTLPDYIFFAYKVLPNQGPAFVKQLPDWAQSTKYDIEAKVSGNPGKDDMRVMMQSLLAERFGLKMHTEMQEISLLTLVQAKPGVMGKTLKVHSDNGASCPKDVDPNAMLANGDAAPPKETADGFPVECGQILSLKASMARRVKLGARNVPIQLLADGAKFFGNLDKPVVNKTGLAGNYDFTLEFTREDAIPHQEEDATPDEMESSFTNALIAQMGLKLKADKGQSAVLVLDHVERPSEN